MSGGFGAWVSGAARSAYNSAYDTLFPAPSVEDVFKAEAEKVRERFPVSKTEVDEELKLIPVRVLLQRLDGTNVAMTVHVPEHMAVRPYILSQDIEREVRLQSLKDFHVLSPHAAITTQISNTPVWMIVEPKTLGYLRYLELDAPPFKTGGRKTSRNRRRKTSRSSQRSKSRRSRRVSKRK